MAATGNADDGEVQHAAAAYALQEEARRALRFAATQRIKQWKVVEGANDGRGSGKNSISGGGARTPRTTAERQRVQNNQVEAIRLERRLRAREQQQSSTSAGDGLHSAAAMSARLDKLTLPTQASLSRARDVDERQRQRLSVSSRGNSPSISARAPSYTASRRNVYADPYLAGPPSQGRASAASSLNTSIDHSNNGGASLAGHRRGGGVLVPLSAHDANIDEEMCLLQARMRFLEEKRRDELEQRCKRDQAIAESTRSAAEPPHCVYEGGLIKDPSIGRRYLRLFSFRLHDVAASLAVLQPPPARTPQQQQSTPIESIMGASIRSNAITMRQALSVSAIGGDSSPALVPCDVPGDDDARGARRASLRSGSPTEDHDAQEVPSSPTSRWVIDGGSGRRRKTNDDHTRGHAFDGSDQDSPESPRALQPVALEEAVHPNLPSAEGDGGDYVWVGSQRNGSPTALASPSEAATRHTETHSNRAPPTPLASGGDHMLPPAMLPSPHATPLLKPQSSFQGGSGGGGGGSTSASPPSRSTRRSMVGFTDANLNQSPHRDEGAAPRPRLSSTNLLQQQQTYPFRYEEEGGDEDADDAANTNGGTPPFSRSSPDAEASKQAHTYYRRSNAFLEPDASFYRGRDGSSGVLGATASQAQLLVAAAAQEGHQLTREEFDHVAQLVIPADVEASFQLLDDDQKRVLVRRYSTMQLKRMKSNVGR